MPLNTAIERDGEPLKVRWGGFHMMAMLYAVSWDSGKGCFEDNTEPPMQTPESSAEPGKFGPLGHYVSSWQANMIGYHHIAATPLNEGSYTLKKDYTFVDTHDGEVLELKAGDVLKAYRSSK